MKRDIGKESPEDWLWNNIKEDRQLELDLEKQAALHSCVHPYGFVALIAGWIIRRRRKRYAAELDHLIVEKFDNG